MEEMEQVNSDVSSEASSEPQSTPSSNESSSEGEGSTQQAQPKQESVTPFHEHPRFKEVIEQKNQALAQMKALEDRLARMESEREKVSKAKTEEDALLARLKGIDPEFASRIEEIQSKASKVDELLQRFEQSESQNLRTQAINTVNNLHEQNKIPAEMRELYNTQLELAAARNPNMTLADIPAIYKQVHDGMSKIVDGIKRAERESYLQAKKSDVKSPTPQSKGQVAKPNGKFEFSKDPDKARNEAVSRILKLSKANNAI